MHIKPKAPVSQLTKLIRNEASNDKGVRPGVRGGRTEFDWNTLKTMSFKERENYLGFTAKLGNNEAGTWRKRDWYLTKNKENKTSKLSLKEELELEKKKDKERLLTNLGIMQKPSKPKDILQFSQYKGDIKKVYNDIEKNTSSKDLYNFEDDISTNTGGIGAINNKKITKFK